MCVCVFVAHLMRDMGDHGYLTGAMKDIDLKGGCSEYEGIFLSYHHAAIVPNHSTSYHITSLSSLSHSSA
jgi:hypothetical protein